MHPIIKKSLIIISWLVFALVSTLVLIILLVRVPAVQLWITGKATNYLEKTIESEVSIESLYLTFRGNIQLKSVYLEDQNRDTLVYVGNLEAGISIIGMIRGRFEISRLYLDDATVNVQRSDLDSLYNFDFIPKAFIKEDTQLDTVNSPIPDFAVGTLRINNAKVAYDDWQLGMNVAARIGSLTLKGDKLDFNTMHLVLKQASFSETNIEVRQWEVATVLKVDTVESSVYPIFKVKDFELENVKLNYTSLPDTKIDALVAKFHMSDAEMDLGRQFVGAREISLGGSSIALQLPHEEEFVPAGGQDADSLGAFFEWPEWEIVVGDLLMEENSFRFKQGDEKVQANTFNPSDFEWAIKSINIQDFDYKPEYLKAAVHSIAFETKDGWKLHEFQTDILFDSTGLQVVNLKAKTAKTDIDGSITILFPDVETWLADPLAMDYDIQLKSSTVDLQDAFYFNPSLASIDYMKPMASFPLKILGTVTMDNGRLAMDKLQATWGNHTAISVNGNMLNLNNPDQLSFDFPTIEVESSRSDMMLVFAKELEGIHLPEKFNLKGAAKGDSEKANVDAMLTSTLGNVKVNGKVDGLATMAKYDGKISAFGLDLGQILQVEELGRFHGHLTFDGKGMELPSMALTAQLIIDSLGYNDYVFQQIEVDALLADQLLEITSQVNQPHLTWDLAASANLDTIAPTYSLILQLGKAHFRELGITNDNIQASILLEADFAGDLDAFDAKIDVSRAIFIRNGDVVRLRDIRLAMEAQPDHMALKVSSGFFNGYATATTNPKNLIGILGDYYASLVADISSDSSVIRIAEKDSIEFDARFKLVGSQFIKEVVLTDLVRLDTVDIVASFDHRLAVFTGKVSAPYIEYGAFLLEDLELDIDGSADTAKYKASFSKLETGPANIFQTLLSGTFSEKKSHSILTILDEGKKEKIVVGLATEKIGDSLSFHIDSEKLVLDYEKWDIPKSNKFSVYTDQFIFTDFEIAKSGQSIKIHNPKSEDLNEFKVNFENFQLGTFTTFLSDEEAPLTGVVNGEILMTDIAEKMVFTANVTIDSLKAMQQSVGTLNFEANNPTADKYTVTMSLKGPLTDLQMEGFYTQLDNMKNLDIQLDINMLGMELIEAFSNGEIKKATGALSGHFDLAGNTEKPNFDGKLVFGDVAFTVAMLNAPFSINSQEISFDQKGINFKSFELLDERKNKTVLNGSIKTESFINPTLDMRLISQDFQLLNSSRVDNDLFYGKMMVDLDAKIGGSVHLPRIDMSARLKKGSSITYIVPESELEIVEREGVVLFFNAQDSSGLKFENENPSYGVLTGIVLKSVIRIDPQTAFTLILDERSGDYISISGTADLNFNISPNGTMELTGVYTMSSGEYELSLYEIVQRRFEIVPGSKITWTGNPFDAMLDLKAMYRVRANASDLMADQLSGADAATKSSFKQELPFEVIIVIEGGLEKPEISFQMDMPQSQRGVLGGNVYTKITQLNNNEPELNKQVFSLIVFSQFLPAGLSGYDGGTSNLARSSVNQVLSNQLNNLSSRYIKGVELDFNLNSYMAASEAGARETTQLSVSVKKALFDDRIVIQLGSQVGLEGSRNEATDLMGDFSVEYLITESGRYRLKGFRRNIFEDVVEGQVIITGLSLMYNREFNNFSELFAPAPPKEKKSEK